MLNLEEKMDILLESDIEDAIKFFKKVSFVEQVKVIQHLQQGQNLKIRIALDPIMEQSCMEWYDSLSTKEKLFESKKLRSDASVGGINAPDPNIADWELFCWFTKKTKAEQVRLWFSYVQSVYSISDNYSRFMLELVKIGLERWYTSLEFEEQLGIIRRCKHYDDTEKLAKELISFFELNLFEKYYRSLSVKEKLRVYSNNESIRFDRCGSLMATVLVSEDIDFDTKIKIYHDNDLSLEQFKIIFSCSDISLRGKIKYLVANFCHTWETDYSTGKVRRIKRYEILLEIIKEDIAAEISRGKSVKYFVDLYLFIKSLESNCASTNDAQRDCGNLAENSFRGRFADWYRTLEKEEMLHYFREMRYRDDKKRMFEIMYSLNILSDEEVLSLYRKYKYDFFKKYLLKAI